jgi:hypothetical protein
MSGNSLKNWRESLNEKYGNLKREKEHDNCDYEEWNQAMKNTLLLFQEEIEEERKKNRAEYELDSQRMAEIRRQNRLLHANEGNHNHDDEDKHAMTAISQTCEISKKRKYDEIS